MYDVEHGKRHASGSDVGSAVWYVSLFARCATLPDVMPGGYFFFCYVLSTYKPPTSASYTHSTSIPTYSLYHQIMLFGLITRFAPSPGKSSAMPLGEVPVSLLLGAVLWPMKLQIVSYSFWMGCSVQGYLLRFLEVVGMLYSPSRRGRDTEFFCCPCMQQPFDIDFGAIEG